MGITDKSRQQAQQKRLIRLDKQKRKNKIKQQEQENIKKSKITVPTEQQLEQIEKAKEIFEESGLNEHWQYYQSLSKKYYGQ